jgi:hypothetical protein
MSWWDALTDKVGAAYRSLWVETSQGDIDYIAIPAVAGAGGA